MELRAIDTLDQVSVFPPTRCHLLSGNKEGCFAITVKEPYRLIIKPDHDPIPLKEDGSIDKSKVTCIKIMGVENYHDQ